MLLWISCFQEKQVCHLTVIKHFAWLATVYHLKKRFCSCLENGIWEICFSLMVNFSFLKHFQFFFFQLTSIKWKNYSWLDTNLYSETLVNTLFSWLFRLSTCTECRSPRFIKPWHSIVLQHSKLILGWESGVTPEAHQVLCVCVLIFL